MSSKSPKNQRFLPIFIENRPQDTKKFFFKLNNTYYSFRRSDDLNKRKKYI
jgi:hypothetical protein